MRFQLIYLQLINFLSHAKTAVKLAGMTAACIQGRNGAGKSSLVDALLWVLFGVTSRGKSTVVRTGQKEATVVLDFRFGELLYRVIRKLNAASRKSMMELNVQSSEGAWEQLAVGDAAKDRVIEMLNRTYETFTTSSVLLQGQGEKFINLGPTKRAAVPFDILGLDRWEIRRAKIVKKSNIKKGELTAIQAQNDKLLLDIAERPQIEIDWKAKLEEIAEAKELTEDMELIIQALVGDEAVAKAEVQALDELVLANGRLSSEITSLEEKLKANTAGREEAQKLASEHTEGSIATAIAEKQTQLAELERLSEAIKQLNEEEIRLQQKRNDLEAEVTEQRKLLLSEDAINAAHETIEVLNADLQKKKEEQAVKQAAYDELVVSLSKCSDIETGMANLSSAIATKKNEQSALIASISKKIGPLEVKISTYKTEHAAAVRAAEKKLADVRVTAALLDGKEPCGLKGEFAKCSHVAHAVEARDSISALEGALDEAKEYKPIAEEGMLQTLKEELAQASKELELSEQTELDGLKKELLTLDKPTLLKDKDAAQTALAVCKGEVAGIEKQISDTRALAAKKHELDAAKREVKRVEAAKSDIGNQIAKGAVEMERYRVTCSNKEAYQSELTKLTAARQYMAAAQEEIVVTERIASLKEQVSNNNTALEKGTAKRKNLKEITEMLALKRKEQLALRTGETELIRQAADLESKIKRVDEKANESAEVMADITKREWELKVMAVQELVYEKIPYFILDHIIPVIEDEANRVLESIAPSGMRVQLVSEKMNQKKNVTDALDIIVSDNAGERPIEMFSGGEKTRLVLALTVGLAELSARRAGVNIGLLMIDEPSGLDNEGMRDFGECLLRLVNENYFDQAFLIAHSEVLKQILPQQILVTKKGTVSEVEVRV